MVLLINKHLIYDSLGPSVIRNALRVLNLPNNDSQEEIIKKSEGGNGLKISKKVKKYSTSIIDAYKFVTQFNVQKIDIKPWLKKFIFSNPYTFIFTKTRKAENRIIIRQIVNTEIHIHCYNKSRNFQFDQSVSMLYRMYF